MVNLLLCRSELFQTTATAVVDILGGIGEAYTRERCSPRRVLPHLMLHGTADPIITFDRDNLVDGSLFVSTRAAWRSYCFAVHWQLCCARRRG